MADVTLEKSESFSSGKDADDNRNKEDGDECNKDDNAKQATEAGDENVETKPEESPADEAPETEGDQEDAGGNVEGETETEADVNNGEEENADQADLPVEPSLDELLDDIGQFVSAVSKMEDTSQPVEIPSALENFLRKVEKMVQAYEQCESKFGVVPDDDSRFLKAVKYLSDLTVALRRFSTESNVTLLLNETSSLLHQTMVFLEDELHCLLEDPTTKIDPTTPLNPNPNQTPDPSPKVADQEPDQCAMPDQSESAAQEQESYPSYSAEAVTAMNLISNLMISAGYEPECRQAFMNSRLDAIEEELSRQGLENISMDDVMKMQWETLEGNISSWIRVLKRCSGVLLAGVHKFYDSVFPERCSVSKALFTDIARAVIIRLVTFAEAVAISKRSTEKLFKFLDMYETLRDLVPTIDESLYTEEFAEELKSELSLVGSWLGEAIVSIFSELESSIKSESAKTPVPNGAVHPLTRYTMNYLKYACEYKDTLEEVFQQHQKKAEPPQEASEAEGEANPEAAEAEVQKQADESHEGEDKQTPFAAQLTSILELLDSNIEANSNLYKDPGLRYIFLMNNGRYMMKNIRGTSEIQQVVGDSWCRKSSTDMRHYHKSYQRETWGKVLQCLNQEGLQVHGKVYKPNLKERFKNFNQLFDEIHKTQSAWVVSDDQLQSELQVSISAVMIPAYRSFLGRFGQYFTPGRQTEKYVKYQPEDIEAAIEELFDGPSSMRRRT